MTTQERTQRLLDVILKAQGKGDNAVKAVYAFCKKTKGLAELMCSLAQNPNLFEDDGIDPKELMHWYAEAYDKYETAQGMLRWITSIFEIRITDDNNNVDGYISTGEGYDQELMTLFLRGEFIPNE